MSKPHKHAELIKAWADGAEIQMYLHTLDKWIDTRPEWLVDIDYRIKPKEKQKVKMWQWVMKHSESNWIFLTDEFFRTGLDAKYEYPAGAIVQRADWTEIEVEVEDE